MADEENPGLFYSACRFTDKVYSGGLLALRKDEHDHFLLHALPRLLLQIALMYILKQSFHLLLRRFSLPPIISKILAGLVLGKTVFGHVAGGVQQLIFPKDDPFLETLTKFGFIFFMFLVGVKMDPGMIFKAGKRGITIGLATSVIPSITLNFILENLLHRLSPYHRPSVSVLLGFFFVTPFPVIANLLVDLKIMNSEIGRLSLASALIDDLVNTFIILCQNTRYVGMIGFLQCLVGVMLFTFGARPLFSRIIRTTPEGKPVKRIYISFISCGVLLAAIFCDNVGLPHHYIPFLFGLAVPDGPPLGSTLVEKFDTFIIGLFSPMLITYCALRIDLTAFFDLHFLGAISTLIFWTLVAKFFITFGSALLNKLPVRDSITLAIIMGAQGIVQGAFFYSQLRRESIDEETFALLFLWLAMLGLFQHLSVKFLYDSSRTHTGYQNRNILHIPYNSELRVLACSHRFEDSIAAVRLLEASSPAKEAPIAVYSLNLVALVGRALPLMINHGLGQKNSLAVSKSQQTITLFQTFEKKYSGLVSVQAFTSMSLPKFMHFDICSIAFDKLASLIILPFHRKWSQQGKIVLDNTIWRNINREVLMMAPCSVGILIDRSKIRHEASGSSSGHSRYHVAVIFLGGEDDREAVAYAIRMVRSVRVQLTVIRVVHSNESSKDTWDTVLDKEILREAKVQSVNQSNIIYSEERVENGLDVVALIDAMVDVFDLIMVGRRHRDNLPILEGLSDGQDVQELGPLGVILASSEINKPVSALVIQQQNFEVKQ